MSTIDEIKHAIDRLTPEQRLELERRLHPIVDDAWDEQMKQDAASGKLDSLLAEVHREITAMQSAHVHTPRLADPEEAKDFVKQVVEISTNAGV